MNRRYFIIHGRTSCSFCVQAVGLLEGKNISYIFSPVAGELLQETKTKWSQQTVPIVIERDLHDDGHQALIGGYTDLCAYLKDAVDDEGGSYGLDRNCD